MTVLAKIFPGGRGRRLIVIAVVALLLGGGILAIVMHHEWPFTEQAVVQSLQQQFGSAVQIASFRQLYFPHPGCVAQGVTFRREADSSGPPFVTIQRLTIEGGYTGLVTRHLSTIRVEGFHLSIAPEKSQAGASSTIRIGRLRPRLTIGQIVADGAALEFVPPAGRKAPLVFNIPKLTLRDLADGRPLLFQATVQIPQPPATADLTGKFGPWQPGMVAQTPLSGSYTVRNLDLSVFDGIAGVLAAKGQFDGVLQRVNTRGTTETPDFQVRHSGHPVEITAKFEALVNGLNGDVALEPVTAHFGRTTIVCAGSIADTGQDEGKLASLQMFSKQARIQDLLRLFVSENTPPMAGPILFRAKVTLPPGNRPFLDKVKLRGDFGISGAQYPNPETQKNIDVLSARALGKASQVKKEDDRRGNDSYDPGRVLSNVQGHVDLSGAVSKLSNISFAVPGALAQVDGTYNLKTEQVNLQGELRLDTDLSKASTGVKSFLLKVVQPLTASKKHKGESIVSLKIGGTYHNPTYTVLPIAKIDAAGNFKRGRELQLPADSR